MPHRTAHSCWFDLACVHGRRSRRRRRTRRHDPQFGRWLFLVAAVHCDEASGINATRVPEIILRAVSTCLPFTRSAMTSAVTDDVALRARIGLQFIGKVVESGFLVVASDVAILVELTRRIRQTS